MSSEDDSTRCYRIKDIKFFGSNRRILLQSANGPCPLLALCNVLLLRNQLNISQDVRYISFNELIDMVTNCLFDVNKELTSGDSSVSSRAANMRESLGSCLEILPRLNVGLDVNCKFGGPTEFEYTQELAVFDLLDIVLYHGWIVSSQDEKASKAFSQLSYNQIVERLVAFEEAQVHVAGAEPTTDEETRRTIEEGLVIKDFMDRTASQLSYEGLLALHETVVERQLAVFFRNSHFSTMLKKDGDLYLLCTDIAFGNSHIVWERLDEVDGDTSYCDADFHVNTMGSDEDAAQAAAEAMQETYLARLAGVGPPWENPTDGDAALALQLMQEDQQAQQLAQAAAAQQAAQVAAQQQQQHGKAGKKAQKTSSAGSGASTDAAAGQAAKKKKKSCAIQ